MPLIELRTLAESGEAGGWGGSRPGAGPRPPEATFRPKAVSLLSAFGLILLFAAVANAWPVYVVEHSGGVDVVELTGGSVLDADGATVGNYTLRTAVAGEPMVADVVLTGLGDWSAGVSLGVSSAGTMGFDDNEDAVIFSTPQAARESRNLKGLLECVLLLLGVCLFVLVRDAYWRSGLRW